MLRGMQAEWYPSNTETYRTLKDHYDAPRPEADWAAFDFIDLASKTGGSIKHCTRRFGGKGIGVDRSEVFVGRMQEKGFDAVHGDATLLDCNKAVRFVSMMNFLEHLATLESVEDMLARAGRAATHFLFIRHPSFEGEETAVMRGYRVHHWNWHHHSAHVRLAEFDVMFSRLGFGPRLVRNYDPIAHSCHRRVIRTALHMDMSIEDAAAFTKPMEPIVPPWWGHHDILVRLKPMKGEQMKMKDWAKLTRDHTLAPMAVRSA